MKQKPSTIKHPRDGYVKAPNRNKSELTMALEAMTDALLSRNLGIIQKFYDDHRKLFREL